MLEGSTRFLAADYFLSTLNKKGALIVDQSRDGCSARMDGFIPEVQPELANEKSAKQEAE